MKGRRKVADFTVWEVFFKVRDDLRKEVKVSSPQDLWRTKERVASSDF